MSYNAFGAKIKVIGVGGGGGNAVNTMIKSGLDGVEFIVANTDSQALEASLAHHKIQLGKELTKGLGAGADPDIGRDAALEDRHEIQELLSDADMVFITAGMGGGTGTGAAAVVAQIARELGALTVAVVTKPFTFEGKRRRKHSEMGIARLREAVDTLITIPNQRLLQIATPDLSMLDAFKLADNVLVNAVRGISDIINTPGLINVDFADVKTVMSSMGHALMGIGYGVGSERALVAAKQAISSPLLEDIDIEGATGILINITAGTNVSIMEVNNACMVIQEAAHEDANIIFGAVIDESLGEEIRITVIATGFPVDEAAFVEEPSGISLPQVRTSGYQSPSVFGSNPRSNPATLAAQVARPFNQSRPLTQQPSVTPRSANQPQHSSSVSHSHGHSLPQTPTVQQRSSAQAAPVSSYAGSTNPQQNVTVTPLNAVTSSQTLPPPPVMDVFQEAKELADWSMQGSDDGLVSEVGLPSEQRAISDIETFQKPGAPVFPEPSQESIALGSEDTLMQQDQTLADMVFKDLESRTHTENQSEELPLRAGAESAKSDGLWDLEEARPEAVTLEIDRKIDEALALAGRFGAMNPPSQNRSAASNFDELDDLDLPAFLRHGASDVQKP